VAGRLELDVVFLAFIYFAFIIEALREQALNLEGMQRIEL